MDQRPHAQDLGRQHSELVRPLPNALQPAPPSAKPHPLWAVDTTKAPADAGETVATVNVAMFGATGVEGDGGVRIPGRRALS